MNTKNNRRRRASIERIEKVFIELLQTKELQEITVSDICKLCELNRSTFYANFIDIYDLADKVREHLEEEVNRLYEAEKTQGFNSNDYLKLFRHIKENQLFYRTYFKLGYDNQFKLEYYDIHQAQRDLMTNISHTTLNFSGAVLTRLLKCGLPAAAKKRRRKWTVLSVANTKDADSLNRAKPPLFRLERAGAFYFGRC